MAECVQDIDVFAAELASFSVMVSKIGSEIRTSSSSNLASETAHVIGARTEVGRHDLIRMTTVTSSS